MKIHVYLNNYFVKYKSQFKTPTKELDFTTLQKIPTTHQIILRGEPLTHSKIYTIIKYLKNKNYILTTDCESIEKLLTVPEKIPYISINYDGFLNDNLRGNRLYLTSNILKTINFFGGKSTLRLSYTLNASNSNWINADISLLRNFCDNYPNMKKPYFMIQQMSEYFSQEKFIWIPISVSLIDKLNKASLLTERSLRFFAAYYDRAQFNCHSMKNNITVMYDGTIRMCMSHRINEVLGDLKTQTFDEIIECSKQQRDAALECQYRNNCWLAHHFKDNVNAYL